jgi:hypothetical protein
MKLTVTFRNVSAHEMTLIALAAGVESVSEVTLIALCDFSHTG